MVARVDRGQAEKTRCETYRAYSVYVLLQNEGTARFRVVATSREEAERIGAELAAMLPGSSVKLAHAEPAELSN